MFSFLKNFLSSGALQPILTIVLIIGFILIGGQVFESQNKNLERVRIIDREVSFDEAVNNLLNGNYEVYTSGSLFVQTDQTEILKRNENKSTPTPSVTTISVVENKYDDILFTIERNSLRKIDTKSVDLDATLFINRKGEIVYIDNILRKYTLYKIPAESEKEAVALFEGMRQLFEDQLFPFTPLIQDYKNKRFNPIKRAYNIYSGKWQHPVYTNNKLEDVILETDPTTGLFKSMAITATKPPSIIYFDFRKIESIENYDQIPSDFEAVPVPKPYKTKD